MPRLAQLWQCLFMFYRIGKTGHLGGTVKRVMQDELLLLCARIGFNP